MKGTPHHASSGSRVEVVGHAVGETHRTGEILEVLGDPSHPHYRVRWEDGHVSTLFPSSDVRVLPPSAGWSERELRTCHGFTVDTDRGHLGSVLHVRTARGGGLELHVSTPEGVIRVPQRSIRHFDPHEKRIAVVLDPELHPKLTGAHPDATAV